jgi:hypothetical protein
MSDEEYEYSDDSGGGGGSDGSGEVYKFVLKVKIGILHSKKRYGIA